MFQADPGGILTVVAVAMCWALAIVLRRVSERASVARKLALLLVIEGVTLGPMAVGFLATSLGEIARQYPMLSIGLTIVHTFGDCGMLALYPPFLAAALQTRITRPIANRNVGIGLVATAVTLFFLSQDVGLRGCDRRGTAGWRHLGQGAGTACQAKGLAGDFGIRRRGHRAGPANVL